MLWTENMCMNSNHKKKKHTTHLSLSLYLSLSLSLFLSISLYVYISLSLSLYLPLSISLSLYMYIYIYIASLMLCMLAWNSIFDALHACWSMHMCFAACIYFYLWSMGSSNLMLPFGCSLYTDVSRISSVSIKVWVLCNFGFQTESPQLSFLW